MGNIILTVQPKLNLVDQEYPGEATVSEFGSKYTEQAGATHELLKTQALALSDTSVGTLLGGTYQLVQLRAAATIGGALGYGAFWYDMANFVVTGDVPTQPGGTFAGVFISAPTKGNWCWIQVEGLANVQVHSNDTETLVIGDTMLVTSDTGGTFNNLADATAIVAGNVNDICGKFLAVLASDAVGLAHLDWVIVNR